MVSSIFAEYPSPELAVDPCFGTSPTLSPTSMWAGNASSSDTANRSLLNARTSAAAAAGALTKPGRVWTLAGAGVMAPTLLAGLISNLMLVVSLSRHQTSSARRNVIHIFIVSMSLNDLLNLASCQALVTLSYAAHEWAAGAPLCHLMPEINMFLVASSLWHQALISIHRYVVVVRNLWFQRRNKVIYTVGVIVLARLIPMALAAPAVLSGQLEDMMQYLPKLLRCVLKDEGRYKTRKLLVFLVSLLTPTVIIVASFSLIFAHVHRTGRKSLLNVPIAAQLSNRSPDVNRSRAAVRVDSAPVRKTYRSIKTPSPKIKPNQTRKSMPDLVVPALVVTSEDSTCNHENGEQQPEENIAFAEPDVVVEADGESGGRLSLSNLKMHFRRWSLTSAANAAAITERLSKNADSRLFQRELQITKMFGVVFLVMLFGFLPYGMVRNLDSNNKLSPNAYIVVTVLYALASCANPLLYGLMNREVRRIAFAPCLPKSSTASPRCKLSASAATTLDVSRAPRPSIEPRRDSEVGSDGATVCPHGARDQQRGAAHQVASRHSQFPR